MPHRLTDKLRAVRKILFKDDPYILIAKKPPEMVAARDGEHVFEAVHRLIDTQVENSALRRTLEADPGVAQDAKTVAQALQSSYFAFEDAATLYRVVRTLKPRRIVEIGSGNSTRIMRRAITDGGLATHITAIDPAPRADIEGIADTILRRSVVGLERSVFGELSAGDIFFVDGSHYVFNGTDATFLFLEVLPDLPAGTIVHVHDICLPFEYDALFTARWYNEQYIIAALLLGGSRVNVDIPVYYRHKQGLGGFGASFWMTTR